MKTIIGINGLAKRHLLFWHHNLKETPFGLKSKARGTVYFLRYKIAEYEKPQTEIETLRQEVEDIS